MSKTDASPLGSLPQDDNAKPVQVGSSFTTTDVTTVPKTSPVSYSSSAITIAIPDGAVEFIVLPTTDLRVSSLSDVSSYDLVKLGSKESFPVARMSSVYIVRDSADGSAYIRFTIV